MRLSARLIKTFSNINTFDYEDQWKVRSNEPNTLYFQLVDLDQQTASCSSLTAQRYLAGIGTQNQPYGVVVVLPSIIHSKTLVLRATQSDPNDSSVWQVSFSASQIPTGGNVLFQVTEGNATRSFKLMNALAVERIGRDGAC